MKNKIPLEKSILECPECDYRAEYEIPENWNDGKAEIKCGGCKNVMIVERWQFEKVD